MDYFWISHFHICIHYSPFLLLSATPIHLLTVTKCQTWVYILNPLLDNVPSAGLKANFYLVNTHSCSLNTNRGQHICYVNMCSSAPTTFRHSRASILHREHAPSTSDNLFDVLLSALPDHSLTPLPHNTKKLQTKQRMGFCQLRNVAPFGLARNGEKRATIRLQDLSGCGGKFLCEVARKAAT